MEHNENASNIDPDYASLKSALELNEEEEKKQKVKKIRLIIEDQYNKELADRQEQIEKIQHQITKVQKLRHLLRYVLVTSYYNKNELVYNRIEDGTNVDDGSTSVLDVQTRIHPAVKKLLGKNGVNIELPSVRNKRKSGTKISVQSNTATSEELAPSPIDYNNESREPKKIKLENKVTSTIAPNNENALINDSIRNREKTKHRIIVGNISKWIPSSEQDNLTHKWMVYVRGPRERPDVSSIIDKAVFYLHPSYKPHDVVEVCDAPFHLSRRGWGEFPVRVQIFFNEKLNKPVDVVHNLKLDKTYSGRQTLGNETIVDVFLYHEHSDAFKIKNEIVAPILLKNVEIEQSEAQKASTSVEQENEICISENISFDHPYSLSRSDEALGITAERITYENDENNKLIHGLDQSYSESISNDDNTREIVEQLQQQGKIIIPLGKLNNFLQLNKKDIKFGSAKIVILGKNAEGLLTNLSNSRSVSVNKVDQNNFKLTLAENKFKNMGETLGFLFKRLPLISELANNSIYKRMYPFTAPTLKEFVSWNIGKKRSAEWSRCKTIKKIANSHKIHDVEKWSTKTILMYGRSHGFTPLAPFGLHRRSSDDKVLLLSCFATSKPNFPKFNLRNYPFTEPEVTVNVDSDTDDTALKKQNISDVDISDPNLHLECSYVRQSALDCGIVLKSEEIEEGIVANCPERMIFEAVKCLAESLIRRALNHKICHILPSSSESIPTISKDDVQQAIIERPELFAIQEFKRRRRNIDFFS